MRTSSDIHSVIFKDGEEFFAGLSNKYKKHSKGFFILAPSGSGKTYFCTHQKESHWIDGDDLWISSGAHPDTDWWTQGLEVINYVDKRSDIVTMEAVRQGFWVMGASNYWLKPDAIVIPEWEDHKKKIANRFSNNYDGGATPEDHDQVLGHIEVIRKWHTDFNVPQFQSIQQAVDKLQKSI